MRKTYKYILTYYTLLDLIRLKASAVAFQYKVEIKNSIIVFNFYI